MPERERQDEARPEHGDAHGITQRGIGPVGRPRRIRCGLSPDCIRRQATAPCVVRAPLVAGRPSARRRVLLGHVRSVLSAPWQHGAMVRSWLADQVRDGSSGPDADAASRRAVRPTTRPGGSSRARRSCGCTPTRRCSSVGSGRCSCSRCIRWRWPGVAQHSDYRTIRGAGCSAPPTSSPPRRSGRPARRNGRSRSSAGCTRHVVGVADDGRPYSANDPHLLRWVHLAELDSFLVAHDHYGSEPLRGSDRDEYVAQVRRGRPGARGAGTAGDRARAARPAPVVPPRAAGHAGGPRRRPLPAAAAAVAARRPPGVRTDRRRGGGVDAGVDAGSRCVCRGSRSPKPVALRPAGDVVTRTIRWALSPTA